MRITLKSFNRVWAAIQRFDRLLRPYNLKVVDHQADPKEGIVQVFVNARYFDEVELVTRLAHDSFDNAVLAINTTSGESLRQTAVANP